MGEAGAVAAEAGASTDVAAPAAAAGAAAVAAAAAAAAAAGAGAGAGPEPGPRAPTAAAAPPPPAARSPALPPASTRCVRSAGEPAGAGETAGLGKPRGAGDAGEPLHTSSLRSRSMPGPPCRARAAVRGDAPPVGCRRAAPLALAPVVAGGSAACDAPAPAPRILPAVAAAPATAAWHAAMLARRALPAALAAFCTVVEADERTLTGDTGSAPLARAPPPEDEPKPRLRADSLAVCANFESVVLRRRRAVGPNPCSEWIVQEHRTGGDWQSVERRGRSMLSGVAYFSSTCRLARRRVGEAAGRATSPLPRAWQGRVCQGGCKLCQNASRKYQTSSALDVRPSSLSPWLSPSLGMLSAHSRPRPGNCCRKKGIELRIYSVVGL